MVLKNGKMPKMRRRRTQAIQGLENAPVQRREQAVIKKRGKNHRHICL